MDVQVQKAAVMGVIGLGIAALSIWMHIKGKDGSGWGLLAFCFFLASCEQF